MSNYPNTEKKKGLSCMAVGGYGCLVLVILVLVAGGIGYVKFGPDLWNMIQEYQKNPEKAAASLVLKLNPKVEIVSSDDAKRTITFKVKATGETVTATYAAIMEAAKDPNYDPAKVPSALPTGTTPAPDATPVPAPTPPNPQ